MILASRASPPKHLQVPSTTGRNSSAIKDFLLHSPLPSPALPSILPRHGKKPPAINSRRILRYITWLFLITTAFYLFLFLKRWGGLQSQTIATIYEHANGQSYEIVEDSQLPDYASPLAVTDADGTSKWTIHIPANRGFPLSPNEYADICSHVEEVAHHVASIQHNEKIFEDKQGYYDADPNYVDVAEAQLNDLIPFDPNFVPTRSGELPVCRSSLIYVLDATDAGLGSSLLGLWLAYGLAKKENRAFFVEDSHFAYGRYSSLFEAPPPPKCRPAPPTHRVPCPRMSQHLVVTASTFRWTFGKAFREKFSDKDIFDLMRVGYESLFKLRPGDQLYVAQRVTELRKLIGEDNLLAGMHIRRGDRHPEEFQYRFGYVPPENYMEVLNELVEESTSSLLGLSKQSARKPLYVVASDDEAIYHDPALDNTTMRAQERIDLARNNQLSNPLNEGWERGFYASAFWNLGLPQQARNTNHNLASSPLPTKNSAYEQRVLSKQISESAEHDSDRDYRTNPNEEAMKLRNQLGRSYLLDLAILAQTDRVVCTASSRGCRILGVMMGWDKVQKGWWKNIDQAYELGWKADL